MHNLLPATNMDFMTTAEKTLMGAKIFIVSGSTALNTSQMYQLLSSYTHSIPILLTVIFIFTLEKLQYPINGHYLHLG